jgi:hypothetical protein
MSLLADMTEDEWRPKNIICLAASPGWDDTRGNTKRSRKRSWPIRGCCNKGNHRGYVGPLARAAIAGTVLAFGVGAIQHWDGSSFSGHAFQSPSRYGFVPMDDATGTAPVVGQYVGRRWRWWRYPKYLANGKAPKNHAGSATMGLLDDLAARSNAGIDQTVAALRGSNPGPMPAPTVQDWINTQGTHNMMRQYPSFNPQSWAYALSRMPESQNIEDRRDQPNFIQATKPASNEPLPSKMQDWYKEQWESLRKRAEKGDLDAHAKFLKL